MDDCSKVSVSKGICLIKKGDLSQYKRCKSNATASTNNIFSNTLWYKSYNKMWSGLEKKLETINNEMFSSVFRNLVLSIRNSYNYEVFEIPTPTLLTGINMPDHAAQFSSLSKEIRNTVTPHITMLHSQDCPTLKHLMESVVYQFVNNVEEQENDADGEDDTDTKQSKIIRKSQCTIDLLQSWYETLYGTFDAKTDSPHLKRKTRGSSKLLVVIFPDFESFEAGVLQDFILIVRSYLNILPFVLVFGVATSLRALHKTLTYQYSSKINVTIFNSQPSTTYLNNIIEHVFFSGDCSFHLGGKVFNFLTDIFLFYDLSVKGFIKNFKFCMLEHYSYGNEMALCTHSRNVKKVIDELSNENLDNLRKLPSYLTFLKNNSFTPKKQANLQQDDDSFKDLLQEELQKFFVYLNLWHLFLKCLQILVCDLPKAPLGKQLRELYGFATSKTLTKSSEYNECFQMLAFQSKEELVDKVSQVIKTIENNLEANKVSKKILEDVIDKLEDFEEKIETATTAIIEQPNNNMELDLVASPKMDRKQLREKLLKLSKQSKPRSKYEEIKTELIDYLQKVFNQHLEDANTKPFYEIFFFRDMSIKKHILGSHHGAIHTALNNPQHYLQCDCCNITRQDSIKACMPDISILYKLHLEYGKHINLYDWLQSFLSIVDQSDDDQTKSVKPELQARFTQAVADLEYLGFIKSSKRKIDHVVRLTWGG